MQIILLRTKQAGAVLEGLKEILSNPKWAEVKKLWTKRGTEDYNNRIKKYLREKGIKLYSVYSPIKASLVERSQRTLNLLLYKYIT